MLGGLAAAITAWPSRSNLSIAWFQLDDSANAPWMRTIVGFMTLSSVVRSFTRRGLAEPVLEAGRGDACVVARGQGALVELRAEVAGVDVGHHLPRVVLALEEAPGELVEPELLGAGQLDDAVHGALTAISASAAATSSAASG